MRNKTIEIHAANNVAVIWLNRPAVRNALDETMVTELGSALERLQDDDSVRAVVLAGRGEAFCSGLDLKWVRRMSSASPQAALRDAHRLTALFQRLYALNKPTVARVHGTSYAGALGLIAACDVAIAAQDAEFCLSEVKVGLAAASIMPYLVRAIGERQVRRYVLSAELFSAAEAFRIGLIHDLVLGEELDSAVNGLLGKLLQGAPLAQAKAKEFAVSLTGQTITPATASISAERFAAVWKSGEGKEGLSALIEKRPPAWMGIPATSPTPKKKAAR